MESVTNKELNKNWKNALGLALAGMTVSSPISYENPPPLIPITSNQNITPLHPDLNAIAFLESSNGKFVNHKSVSHDPYRNAFGSVGMKPMVAHESFLRNEALRGAYPDLEDRNKFLSKMKSDPDFYNKLANNLWSENVTKFKNSLPKAVYAWRHGRKAALDADDLTVSKDPYVKSYTEHSATYKPMTPDGSIPESIHPETISKSLSKNAAVENNFDLYLSLAIEDIDSKIDSARNQNNIYLIKEIENRIDDANRLIESFALSHSGKIISKIGSNDIGRICVTQNAINDLQNFKVELESMVDDSITIGGGKNLNESDRALYISAMETPGKMVFYTPNIGQKVENLRLEGLSKAESEASLERKKFHWKEMFASHVNTADPHKNSPWHKTGKNIGSHAGFTTKEKDNTPTVHHNKPPPHTPVSVRGLRDPKAILNDLVNLANKPQSKIPVEDIDKIKSKILKLLETFQSKAPTLEELKNSNPEVYGTLVKLLGSIASIGRALPKTDQEKIDKVLGVGESTDVEPVAKSEEVHIKQAAFLDKDSGVIFGTGAAHDISFLPTEYNPDIYVEGFLTDTNEFLTREEAGGLHSEDLFKYEGTNESFILELSKGGLPMPKVKRFKRVTYPVGTFLPETQKMKVLHQNPNEPPHTGWIRVGSGMSLSNDGHPISSRRINGK